tara:strand:+ start:12394 stop:12585 length:192 start_codon:yes stop_codon:yes gene_type:complete
MKVGDLANFILPGNKQTVVLLVSTRTEPWEAQTGAPDELQRIWSIAEGGEIYEVRESWLKERK